MHALPAYTADFDAMGADSAGISKYLGKMGGSTMTYKERTCVNKRGGV